jgi:hypothetical protein
MVFFSSPILLVQFGCRHNICGDSCEKQHQKQHMTLRNTLFDPGAQACEQAPLALSKWLYVNSLRAYGFAIGSTGRDSPSRLSAASYGSICTSLGTALPNRCCTPAFRSDDLFDTVCCPESSIRSSIRIVLGGRSFSSDKAST